MVVLTGLLFYVYRRGIAAAARGDYRHKEVPSEDPYQHNQPGPPAPSPGFAESGYPGAPYDSRLRQSFAEPPPSAGDVSFAMGTPPPHYGVDVRRESAQHMSEGPYSPPLPGIMCHPAAEPGFQTPASAMFQQHSRHSSYAGSARLSDYCRSENTPLPAANGEVGFGDLQKLHAGQPAAGNGQFLAELDREPSRPYAELDSDPRPFAELGGQERKPVMYAELAGARENSS